MIGDFEDTDGSPARTSELLEILFKRIENIEGSTNVAIIDGGVDE